MENKIELGADIPLRIEKIQQELSGTKIDAALLSYNADVYYASGRYFRGYVYVPAKGEALYFVIRPNDFTPADNLIYIRKPEQIADILTERGVTPPKTLGLEMDMLSYSEVMRLQKAFPHSETTNCSQALRNARMVKTDEEIRMMREDGEHQSAAYNRITRCYKADMTDVEFQIEIERILRLEGALGYSRMSGNLMEINLGSVIAGDNADNPTPYDFAMGGRGTDPALPVGADGETMRRGSTIMVDMNGAFNGYQTDMTRVWRLGDIPELAYKAHDCSRRILRECERIGVPGLKCSEFYRRAEEIVAEDGLHEYFMGHKQKVGFIGHGVGIELNEQPALTARCAVELKAGMTLAIEPKFVIPGVGAVGVENTYLVTENGLETLTHFPEEIQEL